MILKKNKVKEEKKQQNKTKQKKNDPARIRTWNPLIRSQMPYPLGHRATCLVGPVRRVQVGATTSPSVAFSEWTVGKDGNNAKDAIQRV